MAGKDRREVLANWLATPENPYFAKNLANIVWAHFFGRGIIDEVDDVRISNPASNQELLDELGKKFTDYKYDFKKLVQRHLHVAGVSADPRSSTPSTRSDAQNFARGPIRRIRAETMLDFITQVTDTKNKFPGLPLGARAVQIADGSVSTLLPDDVRPADPRNGLFVRGAPRTDAVAEPALARRGDTVELEDPAGAA